MVQKELLWCPLKCKAPRAMMLVLSGARRSFREGPDSASQSKVNSGVNQKSSQHLNVSHESKIT
jgi:hypothetical protein